MVGAGIGDTQNPHQTAQSANPPTHRGLKITVAVLTTLIVIALGLLVYGMARTASNLGKNKDGAVSPQNAGPAGSLAAFETISVKLPDGATVRHTALSGARLAVTLALADGGSVIWIFDLHTGTQLGQVQLTP